MSATQRHTLPGRDYHDPEVFALEQQNIFWRKWFAAGRAEQAPEPGDWFTVDVAGDSVIVVRGDDARLRAFGNVCRHRGSQLREERSGTDKGSLMCPYHAWCYDLTGALVATPRVGEDEVDRAALSLYPVHLDEWQGFVFVCLADQPPAAVRDVIGGAYDDMLGFERFAMDTLRIGATTEWMVEANWKILVENYNECLHCPTVHPELVEVIPAYKKGWVFEDGRDDGGVWLAGGSSYAAGGRSTLPLLPTMDDTDAHSVYGGTVFPNLMIDISGTSIVVTQLLPKGPTTTHQVAWYLFHPDTIASADFDPGPLVDFGELVGGQDNAICERVQRGVSSRFFDHGVYPDKDEYVYAFNQRYLRERADSA